MLKTMFQAVLLTCFGFTGLAVSINAVANEKALHGGHVLHVGGCDYEIVAEPTSQRLEVFAKGPKASIPQSFTVKLKKDNALLDRVNVKLMERSGEVSRFEGSLSPSRQSFVGVQFEIELGSKK